MWENFINSERLRDLPGGSTRKVHDNLKITQKKNMVLNTMYEKTDLWCFYGNFIKVLRRLATIYG